MIKGIVVLAAVLVSSPALAAEEPAPLPKEGSGTGMSIGSVTLKVLPVGKDRAQMSWEFLGVSVADDGKGMAPGARPGKGSTAGALPAAPCSPRAYRSPTSTPASPRGRTATSTS